MKTSVLFFGSVVIVGLAQGCDPVETAGPDAAGAGGSSEAGASGAAGAGAAGAGAAGAGAAGAAGQAQGGAAGGSLVLQCGQTTACQRPTDTALSAPFLGAPGEQGCAVNARCDVAVGQNGGKCIAQGCAQEPGDPKVPANITGAALCDAPLDFTFEGKASEIYRFAGTMSVPPEAAAGANVSAFLYLGGEPVLESGVEVGFGGAPYPNEPVTGERWYSIRKDGTYTLSFRVMQCTSIAIEAVIERKAEAATNLTRETATAVAAGSIISGTLGCEEEHWYIFETTPGQTLRFGLEGQSLIPGVGGGASASVLDASLQPLIESGNGVDVMADFTDQPAVPATRDVTFESGGLHYLRLNFWNGCGVSKFTLRVASP